ncbi:hypothetical protein P3T76_008992 [Phytophthora citrophthora]|uniref:GAF domain-containing protein n=1 Tax=Phytophthora citrophthora TaxID=4793 RepID=A0AAD9LKE6_9STRA|nr:hypothetical protein P3T76_008992 [Phytophthora citrophthora]
MKGIYDKQFIYGSIVHFLDGKEAQQQLLWMPESHQLAVKTGCFTRSKLLARNEQWCFLEYFQPTSSDSSEGFSVALLSLPEKELTAGKAIGKRVDQLNGITALLVVDPVPDNDSVKVRVMFHVIHSGSDEINPTTVRARLNSLAEGIPRLPAVVRRRRLGTQVFAAMSNEAQNSRCIACTKGLRLSTLLRLARRCQLCAHNICSSCWTLQSVETYTGRVEEMGVCKRCLEWVDCCNYTNIQAHRRPVQILEDLVSPKRNLGRSLCGSLEAESTRDATLNVIKILVDSSDTQSNSTASDNSEDEEGYVAAVEEYFRRRSESAPAAADCVLANAKQRTYPLNLTDRSMPCAPVPDNEPARLEWINKFGLMDWREPILELDVISSFLGRELGFHCTMVTIVGEKHLLVLSSTVPALVQARIPREQTFCQHLLMGEDPFIIQHPEADVRFYNMNPVARDGAKFYCGIPILGLDVIVLGSICCIHNDPMAITRTQYDTLTRFGQIASKIIRVKAEAMLTSIVLFRIAYYYPTQLGIPPPPPSSLWM